MIRTLLWFLLWVGTLGLLSIDVEYKDGLRIRFHSWIDRRKMKK